MSTDVRVDFFRILYTRCLWPVLARPVSPRFVQQIMPEAYALPKDITTA